ncbi:MAG: aminopeptidase P family protein [Ruminococcus sp.]|nr:aminopeptidase P family protein [Ruminococcus sp.]
MDIYNNRISRLIKKSRELGKSFLLTNDKNIYYFTGLWDSNGYLFVGKNSAVLLVDFRYGEVAKKTVTSAKVIVFNKLFEELNNLIKAEQTEELLLETNQITVSLFKTFSDKLSCIVLDSEELNIIVDAMRIVKDDAERELLLKAQQITERALDAVLPMLKPGVSERDIANELEHQIKIRGAQSVSFDLITITGKKTSLPHGVPSDDKIRQGDFFTFDIGSTYNGYHSDMTRTYAVGEPDDEMIKVYNIVLTAHNLAMQAVKPGVKCSEIDKIARDFIYSSGYEGYFGHATGHGVGLDIHENPTVSGRCDTVLEKGMVITIEPGIYLPEKFGVRIEDTVIVTEDGCESFASLPKELTVL